MRKASGAPRAAPPRGRSRAVSSVSMRCREERPAWRRLAPPSVAGKWGSRREARTVIGTCSAWVTRRAAATGRPRQGQTARSRRRRASAVLRAAADADATAAATPRPARCSAAHTAPVRHDSSTAPSLL
eukprot:4384291-Pleurochrysis_carterae.AAC.1